MSKRTAFWLAWSMLALFLVITVFDLLFQRGDTLSDWLSDIFTNLVLLSFVTVGSLVASRRPENPIGWLFGISTLFWVLGSVLSEYTIYALITVPGSLPAGALMGIIGRWVGSIGFFLMLTFSLLLFPNGHLPSPRWRFLVWVIAVLLVVYSITFLLSPYPYANSGGDPHLFSVRNPIGIGPANDVFDQLGGDLPLLMYPTIIASIISVFLRFRRAQGIERQQLKWFTYGLAISVFMLIVIIILVFTNVSGGPGWIFYLAVACIPITAGIAILRYRLFDIDVLIRRTLIYTTLTVILALLYIGLVFVAGSILRDLLGQQQNPLIIVASTLVVAALFQPLRNRIQIVIDRRFYRRKYDAARTLAAFSIRLRNEVDLSQLSEQLVAVVEETMQPAHVSLWLRPPALHGADQATRRDVPASSSRGEKAR